MAKLREVDVLVLQGRSVGEVIGVTQFMYCRWCKEFGGLKGDQVKRLKELEKVEPLSAIDASPMARDRLRKAVSDLTLEKLILTEAASGTAGPRSETSEPFPPSSLRRACYVKFSVSERFACKVPGQHRSTQRKKPHGRPDEEAFTVDIIRLASRYGSSGYRRITSMLRSGCDQRAGR